MNRLPPNPVAADGRRARRWIALEAGSLGARRSRRRILILVLRVALRPQVGAGTLA
jgi:hypothetical protein